MKKLTIAALASGLLSGAAAAEPLALGDGALDQVNGGLELSNTETGMEMFSFTETTDLTLSVDAGGQNMNMIDQQQDVQELGGGTVIADQHANVYQSAPTSIWGVNLSGN